MKIILQKIGMKYEIRRIVKGMFKSDPVLCKNCAKNGCIKNRIGKIFRIGHILKADCYISKGKDL